jgi:hypothetical protein
VVPPTSPVQRGEQFLDVVMEQHFALRAGWRRLGLLTWRPIVDVGIGRRPRGNSECYRFIDT